MARFHLKNSPARVVGVRNSLPLTAQQEAIFDQHVLIVHILLRRFRPKLRMRRIEYDDAKQVAMCGLWRAASSYNPELGAFFSLAYRCVMLALHELAEVQQREFDRWDGVVVHTLTDGITRCLAAPSVVVEADPNWIDEVPPRIADMIRRRLAGVSWDEVAVEFGYSSGDAARAATRYAYNQIRRTKCQRKGSPAVSAAN